jgi:hypothetical protein
MIREAEINKARNLRYTLLRNWDKEKKGILFILLNPSTADDMKDDPTIKKCISYAKSWGYGQLHVCNLFANRATDPKELLKLKKKDFNNFNYYYITNIIINNDIEKVVFAWGNHKIVSKLTDFKELREALDKAADIVDFKTYCLGLSKDNCPKHPLDLKGDVKLKRFTL